MKWWRCSLVVLVACAVAGCEKPDAANVPGAYSAEYEGDRDTLVLRPDGTYRHVIGSKSSARVDEGKWMFETLPGEPLALTLEAFRFRERGGGLKGPGLWYVEVEVGAFSGEYKLCFDPDLYKCFVKDQ